MLFTRSATLKTKDSVLLDLSTPELKRPGIFQIFWRIGKSKVWPSLPLLRLTMGLPVRLWGRAKTSSWKNPYLSELQKGENSLIWRPKRVGFSWWAMSWSIIRRSSSWRSWSTRDLSEKSTISIPPAWTLGNSGPKRISCGVSRLMTFLSSYSC